MALSNVEVGVGATEHKLLVQSESQNLTLSFALILCRFTQATNSNMAQGDKNDNFWFSQHPVVSAVLWILKFGFNTEEDYREPTVSKLSWKDEHGGEIADFISDTNENDEKEDNSGNATDVTATLVPDKNPVSFFK